jgi:UDP-N-acetylmuramoylalanine--D-glutamate ligase
MRARVRIRDESDAAAARRLLAARGIHAGRRDEPVGLLVVDEWTPEGDPLVQEARREEIPITVLAELVLSEARGPVVGVTGTAGKTSTCRALEAILAATGRPVAISRTARSANAWPDRSLEGGCDPDVVTIAELTSTHLCHMGTVHPDVAVVTMVRPDHVELHGSVEAYVAAKRRLVDELTPRDVLVMPTDDPDTRRAIGPCPARECGFGHGHDPGGEGAFGMDGEVVLRWDGRMARGVAPRGGTAGRAALAAAAAALALGEAPAAVATALGSIHHVPHRMHPRPGPRGITVIDDTMAATPLKGLAAIEEIQGSPDVVVLGGDDAPGGVAVHASADEDAVLRRALACARERAAVVVAFGPARGRVAASVRPDAEADDIGDALTAALAACPDGGTVLVSPMFPMDPADRRLVAGDP